MANGKIKTIFTDKEKTDAIFPRTKVKAISTDDGIGLDAIINSTPHFSNSDATDATVPGVDADTLGGRPASEYATKNFITNELNNYASQEMLDVETAMLRSEMEEKLALVVDSHIAETIYTDDMAELDRFIYEKGLEMAEGETRKFKVPELCQWIQLNGVYFTNSPILTLTKSYSNTGSIYMIALLEEYVQIGAAGRYHAIRGYLNVSRCDEYGEDSCTWEWVNPPLIPGGPYRTTELFNNQPVYQCVVPVGYVSKGENTFVLSNYQIPSVSTPISIDIINNSGELITGSNLISNISVGGLNVYFHCTSNFGNIQLLIKYVW